MHFNIWPTFSKMKGFIVNNRCIWREKKITHFQTTLGAGTYAFYSRLKQTYEE